jgi:hypothetical protein
VSVNPDTAAEQQRQSVQEITAGLRSAVWDLAYAGEVPADQALQLHHAAQLLLSASEQLVRAAVIAAAHAAAVREHRVR